MDSQTSRKIIVASSMAVVLSIGAVTFALSSHHRTSAAQIPQSPPPAVASTPDVPAAVAPTPDTAAAVAPILDAPVVAHNDSVGSIIGQGANPVAVDAKVPANRRLAKAPTSSDTPARVVTPAEPSAGEAHPKSVDGVKSLDEVSPPPPNSRSTTDAQAGAQSTEPAASDAGSPPR
jgi:hypothetical protein